MNFQLVLAWLKAPRRQLPGNVVSAKQVVGDKAAVFVKARVGALVVNVDERVVKREKTFLANNAAAL